MARQKTEFIENIEPLLDRYDGFLLDQWGVLHDGAQLFDGVAEALEALRAAAKRVVIISNSGKRAGHNSERLTALGIGAQWYHGVVTSGETAWRGLKYREDEAFSHLGRRCLFFSSGSSDDEAAAIAGLDLTIVDDPQAADFILLSGLGPQPEDVQRLRVQLQQARRKNLILICSNPDVTLVSSQGLTTGPGALAREYAASGGVVHTIGKPWPAIYRLAIAELALAPEYIVAVGDSLEHDVQGAAAMGIDAALVMQGIHRDWFNEPLSAENALEQLETGKTVSAVPVSPRWLLPRFHL